MTKSSSSLFEDAPLPRVEQIAGAWLSKAEGQTFVSYALETGLDESALATLLVIRELRAQRLPGISEMCAPQGGKGKRVTARSRDHSLKERFSSHASSCGMAPDYAATILLLTEIRERSLQQFLTRESA